MAFESAFLSLMPHRITIKHFARATTAGSSAGSYGTPTYTSAAATTYRGRFVMQNVKLVRPDGSEYMGKHVAWLATTASITRKDKVTFQATTFEILDVGIYPDEDGAHHTKLILT